jgi:hypothetical protein
VARVSLRPWFPIAVVAAALAAPRVATAQEADPLRAMFEQSMRDGFQSPAGLDLRRQEGVVPFLQGVLDSRPDDEIEHALQHLMRMGAVSEPAMPSVLTVLERDGRLALVAINTLGEAAPFLASAELRERIAERVLDRAQRERSYKQLSHVALRSSSRASFPSTRDLPTLTRELEGDNPFRIELALQMLADMGPDARPAVPAALRVAQRRKVLLDQASAAVLRTRRLSPYNMDLTREVREALYRFFLYVAPDEPGAAPIYFERLCRRGPDEVDMVRMIARTGVGSRDIVMVLAQRVRDGSPTMAREAVTALGMVGGDDPVARSVIEETLAHVDAQMAARARAALRRLHAGK